MCSCPQRARFPARLLLAVIAATFLVSCEDSDDGPTSLFVLRPEEIKGEIQILNWEDEREPNRRLGSHFASRDVKERRRAALAAGRLRDRDLLDDLKRLQQDPEPSVRGTAAFSIALIAGSEAEPDLVSMLADPSAAVRASAMLGMRLMGGNRVPQPIVDALQGASNDPIASITAGHAALLIAERGDTELAPWISPWLTNADPEVRWRAAYALYHLGSQPEALQAALRDPDERVRAFAALGMGTADYRPAVPALIDLLSDPSTTVVCAAAEALGSLKDPLAADALALLADDARARRRFAGVDALARSGLAPTKLRALHSDSNPYVRAHAIDGLARAGASRQLLRDAMRDPSWQVRAAAARGLAARGDNETLASELQYDQDGKVVPTVLEGLAANDYKDIETMIQKHLEDPDPVVRATAARLMVGRKMRGAVDGLVKAYEASRGDYVLVAKLGIIEALATMVREGSGLNPIKQGALAPNWVLKNRSYELLEKLGQSGSIEPPRRVGTLRGEAVYREFVGRSEIEFHAAFATDHGTVVFRLYTRDSQLSVAFLEEIATLGYFNDQPFSQIRPALELSGGDDRGDGHGQYIGWVRDEPHETPFDHVQLSFQRPFGRDSGCSRFRIHYLPRPELDGREVPVGELLSGAEVLDHLVPGEPLRGVTITAHEFHGKMVRQRVQIDEREVASTGGTASAQPDAAGTAQGWVRPPYLLPMMVVAAVLLLAALAPLATSSLDVPPALWIVVLCILVLTGGYAVLIWTGQYHDLLNAETPGPRGEDGLPNPPIMPSATAIQVSVAAMALVLFELAMMYLLTSGRSFGRWLFVLLSLLEIALFAAQLAVGLMAIYVLSNTGIFLAIAKAWFLIMDRRIKEYFSAGAEDL